MKTAGAYDKVVKLWRSWRNAGSEPDATLVGHSDGVLSILFSPDGRTLITASGDTTLKVWDIRERQQRLSMEEHASAVTGAVLSSDGTLLVSGSRNGTIRLWRAATKEKVKKTDW